MVGVVAEGELALEEGQLTEDRVAHVFEGGLSAGDLCRREQLDLMQDGRADAAAPAAAPDGIALCARAAIFGAEAQEDASLTGAPAPLGMIHGEGAQAIGDEAADMFTEHALGGLCEDLFWPLLCGGLEARRDGRADWRERGAATREALSERPRRAGPGLFIGSPPLGQGAQL